MKKVFKWGEFIEHLNYENLKYIYLSGSITKIGYEEARDIFDTFQKLFGADNICAVSTFTSPHPSQRKKSYYIKHGIKSMIDTNAIIILGDNTESKGSRIEENIAVELDMPIYQIFWPSSGEKTPENLTIKKLN